MSESHRIKGGTADKVFQGTSGAFFFRWSGEHPLDGTFVRPLTCTRVYKREKEERMKKLNRDSFSMFARKVMLGFICHQTDVTLYVLLPAMVLFLIHNTYSSLVSLKGHLGGIDFPE